MCVLVHPLCGFLCAFRGWARTSRSCVCRFTLRDIAGTDESPKFWQHVRVTHPQPGMMSTPSCGRGQGTIRTCQLKIQHRDVKRRTRRVTKEMRQSKVFSAVLFHGSSILLVLFEHTSEDTSNMYVPAISDYSVSI